MLRAKRLAVSAPREQRHQCQRRPLLAKTKLLSLRNTIGVLSTESILSTNTWWDIINRHRDKRFSVAKAQALRRARWGGSLALELLRLAVLSGRTRLSPDETALRCFSSGQTRLSPDETTSRSISSDKNHDPPDGRPMRIVHQNHFGSQCATESVY